LLFYYELLVSSEPLKGYDYSAYLKKYEVPTLQFIYLFIYLLCPAPVTSVGECIGCESLITSGRMARA